MSDGTYNVVVRAAGEADVPALAGLRWTSAYETPAPEVAAYDHDDAAARAEFVRAFAAWWGEHRTTHLAYVAEIGDRPVGAAWLALAERVPSPGEPRRRSGDVQSVYVLPQYRGGGVGARLVSAVVDEGRRRGVKFTSVWAGRRSLPLYRRLGFDMDEKLLRYAGQEDGGQA
jgi:GNAT superfamily N-acetyltransferase